MIIFKPMKKPKSKICWGLTNQKFNSYVAKFSCTLPYVKFLFFCRTKQDLHACTNLCSQSDKFHRWSSLNHLSAIAYLKLENHIDRTLST